MTKTPFSLIWHISPFSRWLPNISPKNNKADHNYACFFISDFTISFCFLTNNSSIKHSLKVDLRTIQTNNIEYFSLYDSIYRCVTVSIWGVNILNILRASLHSLKRNIQIINDRDRRANIHFAQWPHKLVHSSSCSLLIPQCSA